MSDSEKTEINGDSIISDIVNKISNKSDTNIRNINPLHDSIDVDALINLIEKSSSTTHIEFTHNGMTIIIESQSEIEVTVANNSGR